MNFDTQTASDTKTKTNMFDAYEFSVQEVQLPARQSYAFHADEIVVKTPDEQYMVAKFHEQGIAIEGRAAVNHLINVRIGEIEQNAAFVFANTLESVANIEAHTNAGRLGKHLQGFDDKLMTQTGSLILQNNEIAVRTMFEDMRRPVNKPVPPPAPPRKKGLFGAIGEALFGE